MNKLSLLAVFAHPDDESCGPGGTLAKYAHEGVEVTLLCVTRGENGAWGSDQSIPKERFAALRIRELVCACRSLGIRRWTWLGYPDGEIARYNIRVLTQDILLHIWKVRPQVVITHWPEGTNGHADHDGVARAVTEAYQHAGDATFCKFIPGCAPYEPAKLYYAVPPDPQVAQVYKIRRPLTVVDATDYVEAKMQALRCHASQRECWKGLLAALQHTSRWTEAFYLADTRVASTTGPEDDLFASVGETAVDSKPMLERS